MIYLYFALFILLMNIIGFIVMYVDKNKAKKGSYRISEKAIFTIALLFGAIGVYAGMYKFRHKTQHKTFTIGIPVLIVINVFAMYYILSQNFLNYFASLLNLWMKKTTVTHNCIRWLIYG